MNQTFKTLANQKTTDLGLFVPDMTSEQIGNVERWIADLRSEKYNQSRVCKLIAEDGYCCLGIAELVTLDIHEQDELVAGALSKNALRGLGLDTGLGELKELGDQNLSNLNDNENWTFLEIAQLLEDQLNLRIQGQP